MFKIINRNHGIVIPILSALILAGSFGWAVSLLHPQDFKAELDSPNLQDSFSKANDLLIQNKTAQAIETYQQLLVDAPEQPMIWHNLGIAFLEANKLGNAIHAFKKAMLFNPSQKESLENLWVTRNMLPEGYKTLETPLSLKFLFFFYYLIPYPILIILLLVFLGIGMIFIAWYFVTMRSHSFHLKIALVAYAISIILLGTIIAKYSSIQYERDSVHGVIVQNAPLRMLPSFQRKESEMVPEGTEVTLTEMHKDQWVRIMLPDKRFGYVTQEYIAWVEPPEDQG